MATSVELHAEALGLDDTIIDDKSIRTYPILFKPSKEFNADELHAQIQANVMGSFCVRLFRAMMMILIGLVFLGLLVLLPQKPLSVIIGSGVFAMYAFYFLTLFSLLLSGTRNGRALYRVYSVSALPPKWAKISISSHQLLYKNKAIQSISELSAIDGGVPNTMLVNLSASTWAILIMHLGAFYAWNCDFRWDVADFCEIVGVAGLLFIGMFELDPYNKWMKRSHYFGAFMGTGTIAGYLIQQISIGTKIWLPIAIAVVAAISFGIWQYFNWQTEKYEANYENIEEKDIDEIKDELTRWTVKNIISEAIFLFAGAASTCLWMIEYDQNCAVGCRGPYHEACDFCNEFWTNQCS